MIFQFFFVIKNDSILKVLLQSLFSVWLEQKLHFVPQVKICVVSVAKHKYQTVVRIVNSEFYGLIISNFKNKLHAIQMCIYTRTYGMHLHNLCMKHLVIVHLSLMESILLLPHERNKTSGLPESVWPKQLTVIRKPININI